MKRKSSCPVDEPAGCLGATINLRGWGMHAIRQFQSELAWSALTCHCLQKKANCHCDSIDARQCSSWHQVGKRHLSQCLRKVGSIEAGAYLAFCPFISFQTATVASLKDVVHAVTDADPRFFVSCNPIRKSCYSRACADPVLS
jgi:hypothetical protein